MSGQNHGNRNAKIGTDTLLGAGLRFDGNIACGGVLRIQGEVRGDVSCAADSDGMIVVGQSGNVAGAIRAPHIVVGGHVCGPMDASGSIEIQAGAGVAGNATYRAIRIHPGGIIEGTLTPMGSPDGDALRREGLAPSALATMADGDSGRSLKGPGLVGALVLLAAAIAFGLADRRSESTAPAVAEIATKADPAIGEASAAPMVPANAARLTEVPDGTAGAAAGAIRPAQEPPAQVAVAERDEVIVVRGVNPGKPGGVFSVVGREPAVLFRKTRDDSSEGTRIDVSQGAAASISFAANEIFRVKQGRDIEIFYQGRKVGSKIFESGAWMSFVPQASAATGEKR